MTPEELLEQFRYERDDVDVPYLWTDDEFLRYVVDAQDRFVRATGGIPDSLTAAITDIAWAANDVFVSHSPYLLKVTQAKRVADSVPVEIINYGQGDSLVRYGMSVDTLMDTTSRGPVYAAVLGMEKHKLRLVNIPSEAGTLRLLGTRRLPYPRLTALSGTFEIDEQFHDSLLLWCHHRALKRPTADTYDADGAEGYRLKFEAALQRADADLNNIRSTPRVVRYGGI